MKFCKPVQWLLPLLFASGMLSTAAIIAHGATTSGKKEQVVKVVAKRFVYTPNEIVLKTGVPAVLEFTSLDFVHGFKVPDLNLRADLPPGKTTVIRFTPERAGVYDFLCDNFCGSGHEEMNGRILVKD